MKSRFGDGVSNQDGSHCRAGSATNCGGVELLLQANNPPLAKTSHATPASATLRVFLLTEILEYKLGICIGLSPDYSLKIKKLSPTTFLFYLCARRLIHR
jgi:hypothetical protein